MTLQLASTDADLLPVVDADDLPVGVMPRRQVHLGAHRHRAVHVGVFNPARQIWLQLRSAAKDTFPLHWDLSCTGHVDPNETYAAAARRELREELGIDAEPAFITKLPATARSGWEFHAIYLLRHDGQLDAFDRNEIAELRLFDPKHLAPGLPLAPGVMDGLPRLLLALARQ